MENYNSANETKDANALYVEYLLTGDTKALEASAEKGNVPAMLELYRTLYLNDRTKDEAMQWLVKAAKTGDAESQYELAMQYLRGHLKNTEYANVIPDLLGKLYDKTISEDDYGVGSLADLYYEAKDYENARKMFLKAEEINESLGIGPNKNDKLAFIYYEGLGCEVDYKKAAYYFDRDTAKFQKYLAANGGDIAPEVWKKIADHQYEKNMELRIGIALMKENWDRAIELYERLGTCRKNQYNNIAWAYCMTNNYEAALTLAYKAIAIQKKPNAYDTLATALEGLGRYDEALSAFETCLSMYVERYNKRGIGETEEKIKLLKKKMNHE